MATGRPHLGETPTHNFVDCGDQQRQKEPTVGRKTRNYRTLAEIGQATTVFAECIGRVNGGSRSGPELTALLQAFLEGGHMHTHPGGATFGLWTPASDYADRLEAAKERFGWKLPAKDIEALRRRPLHHTNRLTPTSLRFWIGGTLEENVTELLRWLEWEAGRGRPAPRCDLRTFDDHLQNAPGVELPEAPGVSYCTVRLSPRPGPSDRSIETLDGWRTELSASRASLLEVLVLMALNGPALLKLLESEITRIYLPGLRYKPAGQGEWSDIPAVSTHWYSNAIAIGHRNSSTRPEAGDVMAAVEPAR
jgi:hypothetical protein